MERRRLLLSFLVIIVKDAIANCTTDDGLKERRFLDRNGWTMAYINSPFTCPGYIKTWKWFPSVSASFLGLIWRPTGSVLEYEVVARTLLPAAIEFNQTETYDLPTSEWIEVKAGDVIGFKFDQALIRFDYNESSQIEYLTSITMDDLVVGSRHVLSTGTCYRTYSISALHQGYFDGRSVIQTRCVRSSTMKKVEPSGRLQESHMIAVSKRSSAIACATSCQKDPFCMSITYEKGSKLCHLYNKLKSETIDSIETTNSVYYEFSYEAVQHYEECDENANYNVGLCGASSHVCRCVGSGGSCPSEEWNLIFKAVSGTGNKVHYSFIDGNNTFLSDSAVSLLSSQNFRLNDVFQDWTSLGINKVKVTLYSESGQELIYLTFNGVDSDKTSWYTINNLLESPWVDLKTGVTLNYFSIFGLNEGMRSFYINSHHGGCLVDTGWLVVIDAKIVCDWETDEIKPIFQYSLSNNAENWASGSIGRAKILTVHVSYE